MVGLINQHVNRRGKPSKKCLERWPMRQCTRRVVWIADVNQAGSAVRTCEHGVEIVRVVSGERNIDHFSSAEPGVAADELERRHSGEQFPAGSRECVDCHAHYLTRTATQN